MKLIFVASLLACASHCCGKSETHGLDIHVVYFAFISPERDWRSLVRLQFQSLLSTQLLPHCTLHLTMATPPESNQKQHTTSILRLKDASDYILQLVDKIPKAVHVDVTLGNFFEYPGLLRMWRIANDISSRSDAGKTLFLYFHSKGMVFHAKGTEKRKIDQFLFQTVIEPWRIVLENFALDDKLNKAGYAAAPDGFIWFNFMWVRGSYLHDVVRPYPTSQRYYYEHWLAYLEKDRIFNRTTIEHYEYVEHLSFERGQLSGCGDSWSMCLGSYHRGISFTPLANMPNYFSCPNYTKHVSEVVNITSKHGEVCRLYRSI